jgi:phosphotransferase system  glucose/maltose/N-acetylglucosamine-specific IIC component
METLKKISGYFLIIIAVLLSVSILATFPNSMSQSISKIKESGTVGIAYLIGNLVGDAILILIVVFIGKKGLKLCRNKSKNDKSIDEIGI